ncbi:hypothetical protein [Pelagibacterium montanilacus]|uniref:hypothetical protein n=1 Tax=Pelagibacterium montanilacus TaxID=2185280 RepID=UPI000F8DEF12|nr:hypothetical protein [Pelagibacterium montanilacus]
MPNTRLLLIAAGLTLALILLLTSGLDAAQVGLVMLGAALAVAVSMYLISRRRSRAVVERERANRTPPKL